MARSTRKKIAARAFVASLLLIIAGVAGADDSPTSPLDILLITADTLRADHLSAYGYPRGNTPALDRVAETSVRFTRAMTPFPRTTPALASLMTGLWPQHHGSREVGVPFVNGTTLAEILKGRGYATYGVSANWVAGRKQNFGRGFDAFVSLKHREVGDRGRLVTERALALAKRAREDQPIFVWAHYMDPHFPYNPPKNAQTPAGTVCRNIARSIAKKKLSLSLVQGNRTGLGEKSLADCIALYDAEITHMDRQIGKLLEGLRQLGRLENVLIVFTADHGETFGEGGLYYEHGSTLPEAAINVPLLIAASGVKPGVDDGLIRLEDLLPTILALAGLPANEMPPTDGIDQSWRLRDMEPPAGGGEVVAFAESGSAMLIGAVVVPFEGHRETKHCIHGPRFSLCTYPEKGTQLFDREADPLLTDDVSEAHPQDLASLQAARERWPVGEARRRSASGRRFKLVEAPRIEGGYRRTLYDLESDAGEQVDVLDLHPEVAARLGAELTEWSSSIPSAAPPVEQDAEQLEMLRALGYVD